MAHKKGQGATTNGRDSNAQHLGLKVTEIGVRHYPRAGGRSTVRPSHVVSTLRELAKMWLEIYMGVGRR